MPLGYRHRHYDLGDIKLPQNLIGHVQIPFTQTQKEISLSYPRIGSIYFGRRAPLTASASRGLSGQECFG